MSRSWWNSRNFCEQISSKTQTVMGLLLVLVALAPATRDARAAPHRVHSRCRFIRNRSDSRHWLIFSHLFHCLRVGLVSGAKHGCFFGQQAQKNFVAAIGTPPWRGRLKYILQSAGLGRLPDVDR